MSRRTVLLGRVSEATQRTLADMPVLKVECGAAAGDGAPDPSASMRDRLEAGSVYILPPVTGAPGAEWRMLGFYHFVIR